MKFNQLHSWRVGYKKAIQIQETLKDLLILKRSFGRIDTVAGTDVSYDKQSDSFFAVVITFKLNKSLEQLEEASAISRVKFPYIPGLLSFREAPVLLKAFRKLKTIPDIILFDGQGIAHPRHCGLASHMGLILDKPSIGCAKNRLIGKYDPVENTVGAYSELLYRNQVVGAALRTKINTKPIFVSPGHKIDLISAIPIVLKTCCGYRIPEPIRQAHLFVNKLRKNARK
ncbi:MAG: endonuclease V [wastewater metagenome]|nr:endonuclease V [Candidatus Loosdrechtia aerotolerans]